MKTTTGTVYNTYRWKKKVRPRILARDPVCRICRRALSTDVDHIDGNRNNCKDSNLQGLCKRCHGMKTARNEGKTTTKPMPGCDADGVPIASDHHWNK